MEAIDENKEYKVQMRTHYGMDLHDYYTITMSGKALKKANHNKRCVTHSDGYPKDNVNKYEPIS